MRIHITTPLWHGPRTGTARPAFGRGRYHVTLDSERATPTGLRECVDCHGPDCGPCGGTGKTIARRDLLFTRDEMVREDGGRL
jgi:hypothetical protein